MNSEEENIKIAEFLRAERQKSNISFRDLYKKSKISTSILCQLEGSEGFQFNPKLNTLRNILSCYDKNIFHLFHYVYQKKKSK